MSTDHRSPTTETATPLLCGLLSSSSARIGGQARLYNEYVGSPQLCVFCRKHPVVAAWRPFCSERCKLLDLAHWVDGSYRVPDEPVESPDEGDEDGDNNGQ